MRCQLLATSPEARYHLRLMTDVTYLLTALGQGDPHAASRLLPPAYEDLRTLAVGGRMFEARYAG